MLENLGIFFFKVLGLLSVFAIYTKEIKPTKKQAQVKAKGTSKKNIQEPTQELGGLEEVQNLG